MDWRHLIAATALLSWSCASLRPLSPVPADDPSTARQEAPFELRAVEGRAQGLILAIEGEFPAEARALALYRVVGGGEPARLQSVPLDERIREAAATGVEVVDREVPIAREISYQADLIASEGEVVGRSEIVTVSWRTPPARPEGVTASASFKDAVELRWSPSPGTGAVIFRRNVLDDGSAFERVAELATATGAWVDRDVAAAGVYSYRVAQSLRSDGVVQYGEPCEEVYASTPEH